MNDYVTSLEAELAALEERLAPYAGTLDGPDFDALSDKDKYALRRDVGLARAQAASLRARIAAAAADGDGA